MRRKEMNNKEWEELDRLSSMIKTILSQSELDRYNELLGETEKIDEHPEDYDGSCLCVMCRTYGR